MRSLPLILGALAATTALQPAGAQDVTTTSFRGFRIEGQVGGDRYRSAFDHNDKFGYGAALGWDGLIGDRIVVGVEGSVWRPNKDSVNCTTGVAGTFCNQSERELGAAVRAGYLVTPRILVFGKGGYVNNVQRNEFAATQNLYYVNGVVTQPPSSYSQHFSTDGYQVGGGAEFSLTDMIYVSGQYVYSRYDNDTSRHRLMFGVGVRFP